MAYEVVVNLDEDNYGGNLKIYHNKELLEQYFDRGEPEDNTFSRDWSWISHELERAYKLGRRDFSDEIVNRWDLEDEVANQ